MKPEQLEETARTLRDLRQRLQEQRELVEDPANPAEMDSTDLSRFYAREIKSLTNAIMLIEATARDRAAEVRRPDFGTCGAKETTSAAAGAGAL